MRVWLFETSDRVSRVYVVMSHVALFDLFWIGLSYTCTLLKGVAESLEEKF